MGWLCSRISRIRLKGVWNLGAMKGVWNLGAMDGAFFFFCGGEGKGVRIYSETKGLEFRDQEL